MPLTTTTPFYFFPLPSTPSTSSLSLHDALPICSRCGLFRMERGEPEPPCSVRGGIPAAHRNPGPQREVSRSVQPRTRRRDRKSTRLNSSHLVISYAVFCLKKKKQ